MKKGLNLRMGLMMALNGNGSSDYDLGPVDHLPVLGADDEGATAYDKELKVPVYFDGQDWKSMVDGATVTPRYLRFDSTGTSLVRISEDKDIYYSLDDGKTWMRFEANVYVSFKSILVIGYTQPVGTSFSFDGNSVDASGDITSLVNGRGGDVALTGNAFSLLFQGCTALRSAPYLPSTVLGTRCYLNLFKGCANIASHHVATLNTSTNVFEGNSSCASLTIDAVEPPTIAATTISGLKAECVIYVPAASVDAYKAAQYWSGRADYIQAIP